MGFNLKRRSLWLYSKVVRGDGTPEYIARGWAIGVFIGSVIPIFMQLIISIPLSFLLKGSKIGATLGTMHTNPVTVFFIYPVQCYLGNRLIGGRFTLANIRIALDGLVQKGNFEEFSQLGKELIISFFVGGFAYGVVATVIVYFLVLSLVRRYRKFRENHPWRLKLHLRNKEESSGE